MAFSDVSHILQYMGFSISEQPAVTIFTTSTLKMEAGDPSDTLVPIQQTTPHHILENVNLSTHCHKHLIPHICKHSCLIPCFRKLCQWETEGTVASQEKKTPTNCSGHQNS